MYEDTFIYNDLMRAMSNPCAYALDNARRYMKRGPKKLVRHQETCTCGRKNVNLYFRDNVWKCKKCWDEEDKKGEVCEN